MTALSVYSTGTVSVSAGGTTVTGSGTIWSGTNVKPGDILQIGNFQSVISDLTDTTHLVIPPWGGGAQTGVAYQIWQVSPQRFAGAQAMQTVSQLVAAFNTSGFFVFVDTDETDPDPSLGDDGQFAFQPTTGKTWEKAAGVWTYLGIYKAFQLKGAWSGATAYAVGDVATLSGSSYVCVLDHTNQTPPNTTYWQLLASIGSTGPTGATGASYGGTSTTSLAIGTGSKVFTTEAGLAYTNGARVRASSAANTANWMEGRATYSGTTLTVDVDKVGGSGTLADWNLNLAGEPGAGDLSSANNLSDLASAATAATNLGVVRYAAQSLTAAQQAQARANINVQKKNYLLNGGMMVSQENGSAAGTTNGYYAVDQFAVVNSSAVTFSVAQVASPTPGGSPNRMRITATSAVAPASGAYMTIRQRIEGLRVADLLMGSASAKAIILQFGVKAPQGTYGVTIYNSAADRVFVGQFTISVGEANADVVKFVSVAGDTAGTWLKDTGIGLAVDIVLTSAGTAQVAPAAGWQASPSGFYTNAQTNFFGTNGNVFELFDVGLYEGAVAPAFQLPDYPSELLACQRYFWNYVSSLSLAPIAMSVAISSTQSLFSLNFAVPMRAAPSVTATGSSGYRLEGSNTVAINSFTFSQATTQSVRGMATVSSGLTAGQAYQINTNAGGNFTANARL